MVLYLKKELTFAYGSGVKSVAACELLGSGNLSCAWMWLISHGWTEVAGRCVCGYVGGVLYSPTWLSSVGCSFLNSPNLCHEWNCTQSNMKFVSCYNCPLNILIALEQILIFKAILNSKTGHIIVKWHHVCLSGLGLALIIVYYFCSEASEDIDTSNWSDCKTWKRNLLEVWSLWKHYRKMD